MLLSSGVIWRHRSFEAFREECPGGDPALQRLLFERLDDALDWLERSAVPASGRDTGNPHTVGRRFDPRALTDALACAAGRVSLSRPLVALPDEPVVLATGGFGASFARERGLPLRAAPWSEGDGLRLACERGAAVTYTIGGLRIDERARVLREDGSPIAGLYAAGADAGGIATGGYASGLASALVLGLVAAEDAVASSSK